MSCSVKLSYSGGRAWRANLDVDPQPRYEIVKVKRALRIQPGNEVVSGTGIRRQGGAVDREKGIVGGKSRALVMRRARTGAEIISDQSKHSLIVMF